MNWVATGLWRGTVDSPGSARRILISYKRRAFEEVLDPRGGFWQACKGTPYRRVPHPGLRMRVVALSC